jgi:uncharacterized repeat protein (TIGR02059 family)
MRRRVFCGAIALWVLGCSGDDMRASFGFGGFGKRAVAGSYTPPLTWNIDPALLGSYRGDSLADRALPAGVPGPFGPLTESGGATTTTAGPDGSTARVMSKSTGGFLVSANSTPVFLQPCFAVFIGRFTGTPAANDTLVGSKGTQCNGRLRYVDSTHVALYAGGAASVVTTPTNWHVYVVAWGGAKTRASIDGGAFGANLDAGSGAGHAGVAIGGTAAGANRADGEWLEYTAWQRPPTQQIFDAYWAELRALYPSVVPATAPTIPADLFAADPPGGLFDVAEAVAVVCSGASNISNFSIDAAEAPNGNVYMLGNDYTYKICTQPYDSPTGQVDSVSVDSVSTIGACVTSMANRLNEEWGRKIVLVPVAKSASWISDGDEGATSTSSWKPSFNRNLMWRDTLYGSLEAHFLQLMAHGFTRILWVHDHGTLGSPAARTAWATDTRAMIDLLRARTGLGLNLKCFLPQLHENLPSWESFRTDAQPLIHDPSNGVYFVPGVTGADSVVESGDVHLNAASNNKKGREKIAPFIISTIDLVAPALPTCAIPANGLTLTLTYNEALDAASVPSAGAFSLAGTSSTVASVAIVGAVVTLTLNTAAFLGQTITVSYTPGGAPIQDAIGNDAAAFTNRAVTNNSTVSGGGDVVAPAISSAAVNTAGTSLTLTYSEALDTGSTPATGAFSLTGTPAAVTVVNVTGSTVVLTCSPPISQGQTVTVNYTPGGSPIQDVAGNDALALSGQAVTNSSTRQYLPSDEAGLVLWFDVQDAANITVVGGTAASAIKNKVSGVSHAVVSANCPYEATGLNGHPCLHPTGPTGQAFVGTEAAVLAAQDDNSPYTVVYVIAMDAADATNIVFAAGVAGALPRRSYGTNITGGGRHVHSCVNNANTFNLSATAGVGSSNADNVSTSMHRVCWHSNGGASAVVSCRVNNGAADPNGTSCVAGTLTPTRYKWLSRADDASATMAGKAAEHLLWNVELDAAARGRVDAYLAARWS